MNYNELHKYSVSDLINEIARISERKAVVECLLKYCDKYQLVPFQDELVALEYQFSTIKSELLKRTDTLYPILDCRKFEGKSWVRLKIPDDKGYEWVKQFTNKVWEFDGMKFEFSCWNSDNNTVTLVETKQYLKEGK